MTDWLIKLTTAFAVVAVAGVPRSSPASMPTNWSPHTARPA